MAMQDTTPSGDFDSLRGGPASTYSVGENVLIWKYGCVYIARVVKVGKTRVTVHFQPKTSTARDFTFDGYGVQHYLRHGPSPWNDREVAK